MVNKAIEEFSPDTDDTLIEIGEGCEECGGRLTKTREQIGRQVWWIYVCNKCGATYD